MKTISLLHATKGRVDQALTTMHRWLGMASGENTIEYIFSVDDNDHESLKKLRMINCKLVVGKNRGNVDAYNAAAKIATGDVLVQVHDDLLCPVSWDIQILRYLKNTDEKKVLHVDDGRKDINHVKPGLITINIVTRAWYEARGYFYYPDYISVWCDDDLTAVAKNHDAIVDVKDRICFYHAWAGPQADKTYADSYTEKNWKHGEAVYNARKEQGFPEWTR